MPRCQPPTPASRRQWPDKPLHRHSPNDLLVSELTPLAVALPRMVEQIEAGLANKKLEPAEERRLPVRADLIRWLLAPRLISSNPS